MMPQNLPVAPRGGSRLLSTLISRSRWAFLASTLLALGTGPVLNAATATPQSVSMLEDAAAVPLVLTGSGAGLVSYSILTQPTQGVLTGTAPNLFYRPNTNANGVDSFTFKVSDTEGDSTPATVSISIAPVNDAPVAIIPVVDTPAGVPWV